MPPEFRVSAIERWTPRSLQFEPPELTPSGVTRQIPIPRVTATTAAARTATASAGAASRSVRTVGPRMPRSSAIGTVSARSPATPNTTPRLYPPERWLSQWTRCVETATVRTTASPRRPAASIRDRRPATRSQPGTNTRIGHTTTTATGGTSQASDSAAASATLARRARPAGGLIGCGSYDGDPRLAADAAGERAGATDLAGRRGVRSRLRSRCARRRLRDLRPDRRRDHLGRASPGASRCAESAGPGHRARLDLGGDRRRRDRPAGGLFGRSTTRWGSRCADDRHRRTDHRDPQARLSSGSGRTSSSRSSWPSGYSFPSGHTTNATIAYGVLGVLVARLPWPPPSAWRSRSFSARSSSASACRGCGSGFTIRPTSLPGGSSVARSC